MNRSIKNHVLLAVCGVFLLLEGCFPDNSLEWSTDGSWGLLRVKGGLYTVDGTSGELMPVEPEGGVSIMPDISADAKQIAYVHGSACTNVEEGFRLFPPAVVNMIKHDAQQLERKVVTGVILPMDLPSDKDRKIGYMEPYFRWVVRSMCANPNADLVDRLGQEKLAECRKQEIGYTSLIVADRANPRENKTLVTMPVAMYRPRFSPDERHVAYIMPVPQDEETAILLVASVDRQVDAMEVARGVALGYDWRPDGKALAYMKQAGDTILGTIEEKVVVDDRGTLAADSIDITKEVSVCTSRSSGQARQFAGTPFQPAMHVQYGPDGRVLFSSLAATIPTTELDEPKSSLFCYDRLTGTVTDILPGIIRNQASQNSDYFRLSPDGKRLLVPLKYNRFAIYELGSNDATFPLEADEGFGDEEMPDFVPSWRSSDEITCLVPETSHFLLGADGQPHRRKEVVVLGIDGKLQRVLSRDWPDEATPQATKNNASDMLTAQ